MSVYADSPYSNERLFWGALLSTALAAGFPAVAVAVDGQQGSFYGFVGWILLTISTLLIGSIVGFFILWPAALLLSSARVSTTLVVVLCGTFAWPALIGLLIFMVGDSGPGLLVWLGVGVGIGLITSTLFALVAGVWSPWRRTRATSSP